MAQPFPKAMVEAKPEKIGAGMLLCSNGQALVLLRNSKNNHNKWGLPGGNVDLADGGSLMVTAQREAVEEMAHLPELEVLGSILTKRGKRLQKHYTVFVCNVHPSIKSGYVPRLNEEHSAWRWFDIDELRGREDLHPVVELALRQHWDEFHALVRGQCAAA